MLEEWNVKSELQQQRENELKKIKPKGKNAILETQRVLESQKSIADIIATKEGG